VGRDPWAVYYDPERDVIGILDKANHGYEVVGLDLNGSRVEGYAGRRDLTFFFPSIVRGDGTVELEIPRSGFRLSPKTKKLATVSSLTSETERKDTRKDTVLKVGVYDINSKSLFREKVVNLGRAELQDFAVDDDGRVYLLTEDSVFVVEEEIRRTQIINEAPMFETPKESISKYEDEYRFWRCRSACRRILWINNLICILIEDAFVYGGVRYGHYYQL